MTLSYPLRLMCLSLACLFAVNLAASLAVRCFAAPAIRRAERMKARAGARFLLVLRLYPAAFAILCVVGLCVPSYLWLEPAAAGEQAGALCLIAAALGAALWIVSIARAALAAIRSFVYVRACRRSARSAQTRSLTVAPRKNTPASHSAHRTAPQLPILQIPDAGRVVALAGIFRSQLVMSGEVAAALDPDQFDAVVRHELAHHVSRDNLKRLSIALAPGLFLGLHEQAWKRLSEWAADDCATEGDVTRSADLASALVRVARLNAGALPPALATPLAAAGDFDLAARIDRLLEDRGGNPPASYRRSRWSIAACVAAIVGIAMLSPSALSWVHQVLERLMD